MGIVNRVGKKKKMEVGSRKGGKSRKKKNSFLKLYTKFFGGKIFSATRVVSSKNSQLAPRKYLHNEKLRNVGRTHQECRRCTCSLASKNLRDLRVPLRSSLGLRSS